MATSTRSKRPLQILIVGDKDTGKHCYVLRLVDNKYPRETWTNKECDFWSLKVKFEQEETIAVQVYVIRGCDRGKSNLKRFYKAVDGCIVMFDVTNPETYDNIVGWKVDIDAERTTAQVPAIVLANKCDLVREDGINEKMENITGFCEALNFRGHFETSSKDNVAIQESFQHLIREILLSPSVPVIPEMRPRSMTRPRTRTASGETMESPTTLPRAEYRLKILVIGDIGTGKTALIQRYVKNTFSTQYRSTIGTDMAFKKVRHHNVIVNVQIWDIAGDERFGTMTHVFYKDTAGCLIVFDESKTATLNGAVRWKKDFDDKVNIDEHQQVPCVLVGNKCDLPKDAEVNNTERMTNFCRTHQFIRWFETSAKDNTNIAETFEFMINEIMENIGNEPRVVRRPHSSDIIQITTEPPAFVSEHKCC